MLLSEQTGRNPEKSTTFKDALEWNRRDVASILLGTDGTTSAGTGGVYLSPLFGAIRRDIINSDITTVVRAVNQGHISPWLSEEIEEDSED
jgi:phage gp29-like protein